MNNKNPTELGADHVQILSEEELQDKIASIRMDQTLVEPPRHPVLPVLYSKGSMGLFLKSIQDYISRFEYNHTGKLYSEVKKNRSFHHLINTAKHIIVTELPIQCLEAVVVATYLTASKKDLLLDRYPLSFKTTCQGQTFRHIVLVVKITVRWLVHPLKLVFDLSCSFLLDDE